MPFACFSRQLLQHVEIAAEPSIGSTSREGVIQQTSERRHTRSSLLCGEYRAAKVRLMSMCWMWSRYSVSAACIQQRRSIHLTKIQYLTDKDGVVAGLVLERALTLEPSRAILQNRHATFATVPSDPCKAVGNTRRELLRETDLVRSEHTDRIVSRLPKYRRTAGIPIQTPKHQRRIQRDRIKRIGGQPDRGPILRNSGDYGNACREPFECVSKLQSVRSCGHAC